MAANSTDSSKVWATFNPDFVPSTLRVDIEVLRALTPGAIVVDLGCGVGKTCWTLMALGAKTVVGIDISRRALLRAASRQETHRPFFVVADVRNIPLSDVSVDVVIAEALMTTFADAWSRLSCLSEVHRILAPGGSLLMVDFAQNWHLDLYRERYLAGATLGGELGDFEVRDDVTGSFLYSAHHYSERELTELVREAGFHIENFRYKPATTWRRHQVYAMLLEGRKSK